MLPAPFSVHRMPALLVTAASLTVYAAFSHVSAAAPASAVGPSVIVKALVSTASAQLPLPFTVSVSVTMLPASAATGVYVGVKVVAFTSVPAPSSVHKIVPFVAAASLTV